MTVAPACARATAPTATPQYTGSIVFLLGGLRVGGAERQAVALAAEMQRLGVTVRIVALADGPLRAAVEQAGVSVHVLQRVFGAAPAAIPKLTQLLRTLSPDVVYAFLEVQWLLATAASYLHNGPAVVFGLRTGSYRAPNRGIRARLVHALACRAGAHARLLVANSNSGLADYQSQSTGSPPGIVIPNGIDTACFAPAPASGVALRAAWDIAPDAIAVGHVGRLDAVKNHELLIDAFARYRASETRAVLVCVGEGSAARIAALTTHAACLGVAEHVRFAGRRSDLAGVYSAFDLLTLSSDREGFPNVVAEAMACGLPAVVTDAGASREIVAELGEVVPIGDAPAFAEAIGRLYHRLSPSLRDACRARVIDNFSLHECAVRTLDSFSSFSIRRSH